MPNIFDGTCGNEDPNAIFDILEAKYPGCPISKSKELWKLQREREISSKNPRRETVLEKAVANLAESCHMPGWFNQCPVASGILGPRSNTRNAVDLVYWSASGKHARLVELKWKSNDPLYALREILRYGIAYLFCRVHRRELPLQGEYFRPLMDVSNIALEVVAPSFFFNGYNEKERFASVSNSLDQCARSKTEGDLSMSLNALAFPEEFNQVPFKNGQDVMEKCFTDELTAEGRKVRDAFADLTPVWPES